MLPAPSPGDDDAALVAAVADGDEQALAALYDRHAGAVMGLALAVGRDRGIAEEVVQETFLALWNRAETFDPEVGSLTAWLFAIARNRSLDRLRWTGRRIRASTFGSIVGSRPDEAATLDWLANSGAMIGAGVAAPAPDAAAEAAETRGEVVAALDVLTQQERETILLAYRDGLSQSEIAETLGWPIGTVKTRTRRALRRLRETLATPPDACCPEGAASA